MLDAALALPRQINCLKSIKAGFDVGISGKPDMSFSLLAEFDDISGYTTYADHPAHQEFIGTHIKPLLAENGRKAIQYFT